MEENRPVSLRIGAASDPGFVREENQDRISRIRSPFGDVFVVADGMGGHEGGATAAQMLIDGLGEHLGSLPAGISPGAALQEAAALTNADIYRCAQGGDPRFAKMGATSVLALIEGNRAWIAHAGDSRAYLWRGDQLERLTRDHTVVQRMIDHQILNEEEARHHPDANVVTRAFGQKPEIELEVAIPLELFDGDRLLLCSDGLSGYVADAAIARALTAGGDAQSATQSLIDLALAAGGEDNVSVQLLAVQGGGKAPPREAATPPPVAEEPAPAPRRGLSGFLLIVPLILTAFLAGVFLPWREWLRRDPLEPTPPEREAVLPASDLPEDTPPAPEALPAPAPSAVPRTREPVIPAAPGGDERPPEILVLGRDDEIRGALAGISAFQVLPAETARFDPGQVYFREGYGELADQLLRKLNNRGARYEKRPWPASLQGQHGTTDVLVAAWGPRPSGEPARPPALRVLLPEGTQAPGISPLIVQPHPGNWSSPERLGGPLAKSLAPGHVYFRRRFGQQATSLAKELGYRALPWPREVETAWGNAQVLVILRPSKPPVSPGSPDGGTR